MDASSPKLFESSDGGRVFKKVDVFFDRKDKGVEQNYLDFEMDDVGITNISFGLRGGNEVPSESVTFAFSKAFEHYISKTDKSLSARVPITVSPIG